MFTCQSRLKGNGNGVSLSKLGMSPKSNRSDKYHDIAYMWNLKKGYRAFPGSPVVKTPHSHHRGHGFDPWSGN